MLLRDNRQAMLQSYGDLLITELSESECPENSFIQEQTDKNIFENCPGPALVIFQIIPLTNDQRVFREANKHTLSRKYPQSSSPIKCVNTFS